MRRGILAKIKIDTKLFREATIKITIAYPSIRAALDNYFHTCAFTNITFL